MKKSILALAVSITLFSFIYVLLPKQQVLGGSGAVSSQACTISTETAVPIGNQVSSTLLAANSRRAWAIVQQPLNATNTINVSFNSGAAATLLTGIALQNASTTEGIYEIHFGLDTEFPYTGAVTGIAKSASSTVNITQCTY